MINRYFAIPALIAAFACSGVALAQATQNVPVLIDQAGKPRQTMPVLVVDSTGAAQGGATNPISTQAKQESVTLIAANTPASAATVYGGNYAFSQTCSAYGTVVLRYRGPDGATMLTLVSKTASDSTGATLVQLGSNAVVDATVSGTTGCNATLSRVP